MSDLSLPEDAARQLDDNQPFDDLRNAGVYVLVCHKPDDLEAAWDSRFENRPEYWADLKDCERVVYVGESGDVLSRLEDHHDGDKRKARLLEVCPPRGIIDIEFCESKHRAELRESQIGIALQNENPSWYCHWR